MLVGPCLTAVHAQKSKYVAPVPNTITKKDYLHTTPSQDRRSATPAPQKPQIVSYWGTVVGQSYRDMMGGITLEGHDRQRIAVNETGDITVVWPYLPEDGESNMIVPPLTGYNFYNSANWIQDGQDIKLNTTLPQSGSISAASVLYTSHGETIIGRQGFQNAYHQFRVFHRSTPGTGNWSDKNVAINPGYNPYATTNGDEIYVVTQVPYYHYFLNPYLYEEDSLMVDASVSKGVFSPLVFHRSSDGGQNFDIQNYFFEDLDSNNFVSLFNEEFSIDARDSIVAIVGHGTTKNNVGLVTFLLKSVDYGETWSYQNIQVMDTTVVPADSSFSPSAGDDGAYVYPDHDGALDVLIDNQGKVHVSTGFAFRFVAPDGDQSNSFFFDGGLLDRGQSVLLYWNEDFEDNGFAEVAGIADADGDGEVTIVDNEQTFEQTSRYIFGPISQPSMSIDSEGVVYIFYSALQEDAFGVYTRDIYGIFSENGGDVWSDPINIAKAVGNVQDDGTSGDASSEDLYPQVPKRIMEDDVIHLIWSSDFEPGLSFHLFELGGDSYEYYHEVQLAETNYYKFTGAALRNITAAGGYAKLNGTVRTYPNPSSSQTRVDVSLQEAAEIQVQVKNILGQEVLPRTTSARDVNHSVELNLNSLRAGIYLCTVTTAQGQFTQKIVKQ